MTHASDLFEVECPECGKKFKVEIDDLEADENVVCINSECRFKFDGYAQYLEADDDAYEDDNDMEEDDDED